MKKFVFFAIIAIFATASVFAQNFTAQSVTGTVQRDSGGRWIRVNAGEILNEDTVIRTQVGASIVLVSGNNTFTIPAGRNGRIEDLIAGGGVGGNVAQTETGAITRTVGQTTTASARASFAGGQATEDEEEEETEQ